jgi:hypothetical protein
MGRVWTLLLVASCYQPSPAIGVECSPLGECPTGQMCVAGTCRIDDTGKDAAIVDDGPPPLDGPLGPWSPPVPIPGVDTNATEGDPSLTVNRLTICFTSDRNGDDDLFLGTRATTSEPFTVVALALVNSTGDDTSCEISADGSRLVFTSNRTNNNFDVYVSLRTNGEFQAANIVPELTSGSTESDLAISPDGLTVILSRSNDPFMATRETPTGAFTTPVRVPELDVVGSMAAPSLTDDASSVYLHAGNVRDLYVATRTPTGFTMPEPITELNTSQREAAPFISADDRILVFERAGVLMESTR